MDRLSHKDYSRMLEGIGKLYAISDRVGFIANALAVVKQLIPCERSSYNEFDRKGSRSAFVWDPDDVDLRERLQPAFTRYMHQHPIVSHLRKSGDTRAVRLSDFISSARFHKLDVYNEFYRHLRVEQQLACSLIVNPDFIVPIALNRDRKDFSRRDLLMLNLLRQHLVQAFHHAEAVTQLHVKLNMLNGVLEQLDQGVICMGPNGKIGQATARALQMLAAYWPMSAKKPDCLPEALQDWVHHQEARLTDQNRLPPPQEPLVIERHKQKLVARLARDGAQRFLFLEEQSDNFRSGQFEKEGLTAREAEVLAWVARGKRNAEIGMILRINPLTVKKHLERIFEKLGTENRTAAAAHALELMRELPR